MSDDHDDTSRSVSAPVRTLVELMENRYEVAGFRFGFDALLGLIPGIGDFLGSLIGSVLIIEALRLRAPWTVIGRMLFNLWLDGMLGSVPVVGDAFDFYFKANRRNLALLQRHLARHQ